MAAMKRHTEIRFFRYHMGSRRSQSQISICCKRLFLFRADWRKNNYEVSKGYTLLLMNINHILKPDTFTILA